MKRLHFGTGGNRKFERSSSINYLQFVQLVDHHTCYTRFERTEVGPAQSRILTQKALYIRRPGASPVYGVEGPAAPDNAYLLPYTVYSH